MKNLAGAEGLEPSDAESKSATLRHLRQGRELQTVAMRPVEIVTLPTPYCRVKVESRREYTPWRTESGRKAPLDGRKTALELAARHGRVERIRTPEKNIE